MTISQPTEEIIEQAGEVLLEGGVVVIPTETVYGLACNAMDEAAVRRVFEIKGRPAENPLIIHLASADQLDDVAVDVPELARKLANRYWPGPLTMVLHRNPEVPSVTTGGLDTVAVRVPAHDVARAIIAAAGCPIAAPSANVFMALSPTQAEDVDPEVLIDIDMIIDGGRCEYGLESTVLDLTESPPRILRPGSVSRADIQTLVGTPLGHMAPSEIRKAPGMYRRHYAPNSPVRLVDRTLQEDECGLTFSANGSEFLVKMPKEPRAYGAVLYGALKQLDLKKPKAILIEEPPETPEWEAVWDRLRKASASLQ
ncbi:MAG: L-threonylcarbamoyladenylate synthase [Fimbriimonadaceae bacterium]